MCACAGGRQAVCAGMRARMWVCAPARPTCGHLAGHEHGVEIRDRGSIGDIAADCRHVADWGARKPLELRLHGFVCLGRVGGLGLDEVFEQVVDASQRGGRADDEASAHGLELVELRHMRGTDELLP